MHDRTRRIARSFRTPIGLFIAALLTLTASLAWAGDWESLGNIQGVNVWRKENAGTNLFSFKGEIVADVSMGKLMAVFLEKNERKYWVDRYADSQTLAKPSPLDETYWIHFKLPMPVSDRDYVLRATGSNDAANGVFTAQITSVSHPAKGEDSCCVRGEARGTYYRFEAFKGEEKVKLTVEVSTDPKGMLPGALVNLIQKSWPSKTLNGLIRRATSTDLAPHPDYVGWHSR